MTAFLSTDASRIGARKIFLREIDASISRLTAHWGHLRNAQLFITGGTGFIGRWLLETLVRANELHDLNLSATVLTRLPQAFRNMAPELGRSGCIRLHQGDVRNFNFPEGRFTHVIHGAATAATATFHKVEDPLTKFETTFDGARRTLDFAVASGMPRVIMLGSGSFYGTMAMGQKAYSEDYAVARSLANMDTAIGHAKRSVEFLSACYGQRYGISVSTARCFTFVGPHLPLDIHYAIGNFIRDALWNDAITVSGDGTPVRSYMYVGDLIAWLITILLTGQADRAYNVGSDRAISIGDLARLIAMRISPEKEVRILTPSNLGECTHHYVPDITRARTEMGLDVWTSLEKAIDTTANFASKDKI